MDRYKKFVDEKKENTMLQLATSWQKVEKQYHWFQHMQKDNPVWQDEVSGCWHVFQYEDVHQVITDYTLFSSEWNTLIRSKDGDVLLPEAKSLIAMDPPEHRQYRNLISSAFMPRALARLSERIAMIAQELLDQVRERGEMDLVEDLAYPLPTMVICELLGAPIEDRPFFKRWANHLLSLQLSDEELTDDGFLSSDERVLADLREMRRYFRTMLEERYKNPQADMMSDLIMAEVDGERLDIESAISFCVLLLLAGHVTTTNLLSQALRCFDEHPGVMEQLRQDASLMPGAIEEVLRYASPVWRLRRRVRTKTTLAGVTLPAGSRVFAWVAAANRDASHFSEPEQFDISRNPNKHLSFGHGIHFCMGAPLSRLETAIALPMILAQLPGLRQIPEKPGELFEGGILFGFRSLPMAFERP